MGWCEWGAPNSTGAAWCAYSWSSPAWIRPENVPDAKVTPLLSTISNLEVVKPAKVPVCWGGRWGEAGHTNKHRARRLHCGVFLPATSSPKLCASKMVNSSSTSKPSNALASMVCTLPRIKLQTNSRVERRGSACASTRCNSCCHVRSVTHSDFNWPTDEKAFAATVTRVFFRSVCACMRLYACFGEPCCTRVTCVCVVWSGMETHSWRC